MRRKPCFLVMSYVFIYLLGIISAMVYAKIIMEKNAERNAKKDVVISHATSICTLLPVLSILSNCNEFSMNNYVCQRIDSHIIMMAGMLHECDGESREIAYQTGALVNKWRNKWLLSTNELHRLNHNKASHIIEKWQKVVDVGNNIE